MRDLALAVLPLCLASAVPAFSADADLRAILTYATFMEIKAVAPASRLNEESALRIAAANASVAVNRTTSIFGAGLSCGKAGSDNDADPAIDLHAFMPPSFRFLPSAYQRDFVHGTLVGMTAAVNATLDDASKSSAVKDIAVGQYLHLLQDIAINQENAGVPLAIGAGTARADLNRVADSVAATGGTPADATLRAAAQTFAAAKVYAQTGKLPAVSPSDKFDHDFYAPLTAADKNQIVRMLKDAGVYRFVEILQPRTEPAAPAIAKVTSLWTSAHPGNALQFTAPDVTVPGGHDLVSYDAHPEWLVPRNSAADDARLVIDDVALVKQAGDQLRAAITRLQTVQARLQNTVASARIKLTIDALTKSVSDGEAALKQAAAARSATDRETALSLAQSVFVRGTKDAEILTGDMELDDDAGNPASRPIPCLADVAVMSAETDKRLTDIARISAAMAADVAGDGLNADDRRLCGNVSAAAILSLFKGGAIDVPSQCRDMVRMSRDAVEVYARTHIDRQDATIEILLSNLIRPLQNSKK